MTHTDTKTVLLVDDDRDFREILKTKLAALHATVHEAENGQEGLEKARQLHPDFIFLDLDMPVMNGIETFRALKADPELRKIKVTFLTNFDDPDLPTQATSAEEEKELKAVAYIRKSTDLNSISTYVESVLLADSVHE